MASVAVVSNFMVVVSTTALLLYLMFFNDSKPLGLNPVTSVSLSTHTTQSTDLAQSTHTSQSTDLSLSTRSSPADNAESESEWSKSMLAKAEKIYQSNLEKRNKAKDLVNGSNSDSRFYYIRPLYPCPLEARVGGWKDGGKWMCMLPSYEKNEKLIVYSIGCNGLTSFESDIWKMYKAKSYTFDPTLGPKTLEDMKKLEYLEFHNIGLTGSDNLTKALIDLHTQTPGAKMMQIDQIMEMLGHDFVDVFKIDCEGCEMGVFTKLLQDHSRDKPIFGQILVEIHKYPIYVHKGHLLDMIESLGYRLFYAEPNFYYYDGYELSYVHESLLKVE